MHIHKYINLIVGMLERGHEIQVLFTLMVHNSSITSHSLLVVQRTRQRQRVVESAPVSYGEKSIIET